MLTNYCLTLKYNRGLLSRFLVFFLMKQKVIEKSIKLLAGWFWSNCHLGPYMKRISHQNRKKKFLHFGDINVILSFCYCCLEIILFLLVFLRNRNLCFQKQLYFHRCFYLFLFSNSKEIRVILFRGEKEVWRALWTLPFVNQFALIQSWAGSRPLGQDRDLWVRIDDF